MAVDDKRKPTVNFDQKPNHALTHGADFWKLLWVRSLPFVFSLPFPFLPSFLSPPHFPSL